LPNKLFARWEDRYLGGRPERFYNESRFPLIGIVPRTALVDPAGFLDRSRLRSSVAGRLTPAAQSRLDRNL